MHITTEAEDYIDVNSVDKFSYESEEFDLLDEYFLSRYISNNITNNVKHLIGFIKNRKK